MSDDATPNALDELDTPSPLKVRLLRRHPKRALLPVIGMSEEALAAIPRRRQRPSLAALDQSARVAETGPPPARANVAKTGPTKLKQDSICPPRVTAGAANGRPIDQLFRECTDAAQQFKNSKKREEHLLIRCLQKAALLYEYGQSRDRDGYERLLARHNIRVTGRTHNPFLPIVKLVFSAVDKGQRTNLSRYAGVLRFAHEKGFKPEAFPQLLKEDGRLDGCAERDREAHPSPERQAAATKRAAHLHALRAQAQIAKLPMLSDELPGGLTALLVEKDLQGGWHVLGVRAETFENVHKYGLLWT